LEFIAARSQIYFLLFAKKTFDAAFGGHQFLVKRRFTSAIIDNYLFRIALLTPQWLVEH